jgi:hypothetical protein
MRILVGHHRAMVIAVLSVGALALTAGTETPVSLAAHSTLVREHVALKLVKRIGPTKFQHAGRATGTVPGPVTARTSLKHSVILQSTVTITTRHGKLRLKVDGRAHSLALRTPVEGIATLAGGTGRYAHAHGSGTFKGVVNRSTWAATIDATGSFTS